MALALGISNIQSFECNFMISSAVESSVLAHSRSLHIFLYVPVCAQMRALIATSAKEHTLHNMCGFLYFAYSCGGLATVQAWSFSVRCSSVFAESIWFVDHS